MSKVCKDCGSSEEIVTFFSQEHICDDCTRDNYRQDEYEQRNNIYRSSPILNWYPLDEMVTGHHGSGWSKVEFLIHKDNEDFTLTDNGEYWHNDYIYITTDGDTISEKEYCNDYFTCAECEEIYHEDNGYHVSGQGQTCQNCLDTGDYSFDDDEGVYYLSSERNDEEDEYGLLEHDYKPEPIFKGKSNEKNPYMGIELEVEAANGYKTSQIQTCKDFSDMFYLKYDGSLTYGFELVTHPMTLQEHNKIGYKTLLEELRKSGAKSHDTSTCGLHVHLDKRKMTDSHKVRFGGFFAVCRPELEVFARRTSEQWCKFKEVASRDNLNEYMYSEDRYEAVNWTNENTVEVRIFRGTLKYETFQASVDLCHAIYTFTHKRSSFNATIDGGALWDKFMNYVKAHKKRYKHLIEYVDSKKHQIGVKREAQKERDIENNDEMAS